MNEHDLLSALGEVEDRYILDAAPAGPAREKVWRLPVKYLAAAACLTLLVGLGGWAYAAEAKEYSDAVAFFEEYDLSTDGLTRTQIKAVYRDITTNSFTYEKTGEVIRGGTTQAVPGMNITPTTAPATPEELRSLWDNWTAEQPYRLSWDYRTDPALGFEVLDRSVLEHYEGGRLVWSAHFTEFQADGYRETSEGVLVWGISPRWSSEQTSYPCLAKVSRDGKTLWKLRLDHGFHFEDIRCVLEDPDGTIAVFGRGETQALVFTRLSPDGVELLTRSTPMGAPYGIWNAARLGEDYVVQLGNSTLDTAQRIVRVDREGNLTDEFRYSADNCMYFITDMAEFGGKLYLSTHAVPALSDGEQSAGGRYDIAGVLNDIQFPWTPGEDGMVTEAEGKTVLERMREHFTAVLLVCDPASGTPETFYTVQGAVGGRLTVEGEHLIWDAQQFVDAKFSPYTSAYSIYASCQVLRSTFTAAGALTDTILTEELTAFCR